MEEILKKLLQTRQERLQGIMESAKEQYNSGEMHLDTARASITQLKSLISKLESEIRHYTTSSLNPQAEVIEGALKLQTESEDLVINIETSIASATTQLEVNSETRSKMRTVKLHELNLPKFNGDYLQWSEFWDRFQSSVHTQNMTNVDKLMYLVGSMEGTAKEALAGYAITNDNYSLAVEALVSRFGSDETLIDAHYSALTNLPKAEYNVQSCRKTLDDIVKHIRVLGKLGENTDGNHFRTIILSKFPEQIIHQYHLTKPTVEGSTTSTQSSTSTIRECLNKIVVAMEKTQSSQAPLSSRPPETITTGALQFVAKPVTETAVKHHRNGNGNGKEKQSRKRKSNFSPSRHPTKKYRRPCLFCNLDNHKSTDCKKVKTVEERKKKLEGRCFKCLKHDHKAEQCDKKISCYRCQEDHLQIICPKPRGENKSVIEDAQNTRCFTYNNYSSTFLQTAVVQARNPKESKRKCKCRIVLDNGSQRSYIKAKTASILGLSTSSEDKLLVFTFGAVTPKEMSSPSTDVIIETKRDIKKQIRVNIVPHITERLPVANFNCAETDIPADDASAGEGIDLLIGNDYYTSFMRERKIKMDENLYVIDSDFGWILSGTLNQENHAGESENVFVVTTYCHCHSSGCPYFTEPDLPLRSIDLKFLWSLECIGINDPPKATRQEEAIKHFNDTVRYQDGRYEVTWPWVEYPPQLSMNFNLAMGRLKSLIKRLDLESLKEYDNILKEQLDLNIVETVERHNYDMTHPIHYLPHHMVKQEGKRGRIVYDASAKTTGKKSLNECLYSGPSMLEDLTALLLKFRTKSIGIVADVEKAFLQVGLQERDRDVTRFLWIKDVTKEVEEDNLLYLRFCRVPFGIISSPFLLTATIRYHMGRTDENLLKDIANNCYVDNLVTGANSIYEAKQMYEKTRETFGQLSMNIRDWVSNSEEFLNYVPVKQQAKQVDTVKILGLSWDTRADTLKLKVSRDHFNTEDLPNTKRMVLRTMARIYDPCGFVCPLILPLKLLFRNICERKFKWDDILPQEITQSLKPILETLETVTQVELPRYVGNNASDSCTKYELHCFSDANKNAYSAVTYLVTRSEQATTVTFIMGKSRIAKGDDKGDLHIPKLELLGFLIASRLLKYVRLNLGLPVEKEVLWTDSLVVLGWMRSNKLLPPFVTNRIEEIKRNQSHAELCYVNTKSNPADVATRPETWKQKNELWFNGPDFLKEEESSWPADRHYDFHMTLLSGGEGPDPNPGNQLSAPEIDDCQPMELDNSEDEPMNDNVNSTDMNTDSQEPVATPRTSVCSISDIKQLQESHFADEIAGKSTHLAKNLSLFLDVDGILRCRGRMSNTTWSYDMKYPILIPRDCELTNRIIKDIHENNYHVGATHTLSLLREKYWVPQGKSQVQKVIARCTQCVKHGGGPYRLPPTPALPAERVNYSTPFSYCGIDYFGPLYVKSRDGKVKRWVVLFTCLAVRAVHLEIVNDLTAEECLLALRRFAATRNTPVRIYSDNATYFKLTSEVMTKPHCIENSIQWKFIPQLAPWHGGFYERLVGIVKHCLKRTLEKHLLGDSQLLTVLKEVEAVVNTRPLTKVGTEVIHILRPSDFLSLGKCLTLTPSPVEVPCVAGTTPKLNLIDSWKRGLRILEEFKKMFVSQYLTSLRERYKHSPKEPRVRTDRTPEVGDVVQIKSESKNRENWKVGKIVDLKGSADGEHRVAKVEVGDTVFTRSIGHLYPLETDCVETTPADQPERNETVPPPDTQVRYFNSEDRHTEINDMPQESHDSANGKDDTSDEAVSDEVPSQGPISDPGTSLQEVTSTPASLQTGDETVRSKRDAAIRARAKISEWTRHLLTLLQ